MIEQGFAKLQLFWKNWKDRYLEIEKKKKAICLLRGNVIRSQRMRKLMEESEKRRLKLESEKVAFMVTKWKNFVQSAQRIRENQILMEKDFNVRTSNTFLEIQKEPIIELKRSKSK